MSPPVRHSILYVEDNEGDVDLARAAVPASEFEIEWAPTAARAREALGTHRFAVVLLDHGLPDANALTFIDEVRRLQPGVPVVILTGHGEAELVVSTRKKGAVDFVLKDEIAADLLAVIRAALRPASGTPSPSPPVSPPVRRSILYVEDNEGDVDLARAAVPASEFEIEWAPTAARAREALGTHRFAVVLLDHGLPDANALTFIDEVRRLQPGVPVVILTGHGEAELVISTRRKGAVDFVLKDEIAADLLTVIRAALRPQAPGARPISSARTGPARELRFDAMAKHVYQTLLETMSEGCLVINTRRLITYTNEALGRLAGCSADELLGRTPEEIFDDETAQWLMKSCEAATQPVDSTEGRIRRAGGETLPVLVSARKLRDAQGHHEGCLATVADIAELVSKREEIRLTNDRLRKHVADLTRAEVALRDSEERFRSIVETTTEWIWETDREGRIIYSNPAVQEILGYPLEDVIGSPWASFIHPLDIARQEEVLPAAQETGWTGLVLRWRHRDGGYRYLESSATPRRNEWGELKGYRGADRDVTERQRMQEALEQTRLQQLELKDQFISHVSHELRSPLTAVYQFVTILLDGLAGEVKPEQREYLEIALGNVHQLQGMIGDLLEVTRAQTGKLSIEPRRMNVGEVIEDALSSVGASAATKGVDVQWSVPESLPAVLADPQRVRQVVVNLMDNAVKFTAEGGRVEIRAWQSEEDKEYVSVAVMDTGRGIPWEEQERIFERMYQGENAAEPGRRGLGLGLYLCKEMVTRQGGQIWVESEPGRGSTFFFTLPVFSLARLVAPILTPANRARGEIGLVSVVVSPQEPRPLGEGHERALDAVWDALQSCVLPDLDVLLPRMRGGSDRQVFFIVACADSRGVSVLTRRIETQLEPRHELRETGLNCAVSFTMLKLPAGANGDAAEAQVGELCAMLEAHMKPAHFQKAA